MKPNYSLQTAQFIHSRYLVIALLAIAQSLWPVQSRAADVLTLYPSVNDLPVRKAMPDALVTDDGKTITTPGQWEQRRKEMKAMIQYYALGHAPPAPGNVTGHELESKILANGLGSYHLVHLTFGPEEKLGFNISIFLPAETNGIKKPFPTIIHPAFYTISETVTAPVKNAISNEPNAAPAKKAKVDNHVENLEAATGLYADALKRGYAIVTFYYQDCSPDKGDYRNSAYFKAYPDYDWADLAVWAWSMSRCVDYMEQQSYVDKSKFIALGHSRLGKASLIAGAFDERFALVAPAGSGCGGTGAYRFNGKNRGGREGLEDMVKNFPQWPIPRLAEFSGQVEKLPFDQHWLIELVAPRCFIAADALDDQACNTNALVQSYLASKSVYAMLGVPDHLGIHFRPGHHMLAPDDWTAILDFSDQQLRKLDVKQHFDQLPQTEATLPN